MSQRIWRRKRNAHYPDAGKTRLRIHAGLRVLRSLFPKRKRAGEYDACTYACTVEE